MAAAAARLLMPQRAPVMEESAVCRVALQGEPLLGGEDDDSVKAKTDTSQKRGQRLEKQWGVDDDYEGSGWISKPASTNILLDGSLCEQSGGGSQNLHFRLRCVPDVHAAVIDCG
ncbi:unnamed protein product [Pleuronectes platessa]|uniref:Uncharacterized protein n=1 Tax=Pleuronectes platessa TaxID=8262 RepID=A0A9N7TWC3_PLEPL|nr:unnamed protein product [Pleuronectes platessa]